MRSEVAMLTAAFQHLFFCSYEVFSMKVVYPNPLISALCAAMAPIVAAYPDVEKVFTFKITDHESPLLLISVINPSASYHEEVTENNVTKTVSINFDDFAHAETTLLTAGLMTPDNTRSGENPFANKLLEMACALFPEYTTDEVLALISDVGIGVSDLRPVADQTAF